MFVNGGGGNITIGGRNSGGGWFLWWWVLVIVVDNNSFCFLVSFIDRVKKKSSQNMQHCIVKDVIGCF